MTKSYEEIYTEKDLNDELIALHTEFMTGKNLIEKEYTKLENLYDTFPKNFSAKVDFEDFLIKSSICKHQAISLMKNSMALYGRIECDLDYYESIIKIYLAGDFLKNKGFDRITDTLRDSYISSNKNIIALRKIKKEFKTFEESSEKLIRLYEGAEINCRKFVEMKNKLKGLA